MKQDIIPGRLKPSYAVELGRLFYLRVNLFCYIAIAAFIIEIAAGLTFFSHIISAKDIPGITAGLVCSIALLLTAKLNESLIFHKARAAVFTVLLISISILAAPAHPELIQHMGITLVLFSFFVSVLLLPWGAKETTAIGIFTLVVFIWIYRITGTFVADEIFAINTVILAVALIIGIIVKRSEGVLRRKNFLSKKEVEEKNAIMMQELEIARKIQKSIIPHSLQSELADIAVTYQPMFYMGGDYAKFSFTDKEKLIFIMADITGHGVSSALLVNRIHTEIESIMRDHPMPGELLKRLGGFIDQDFGKMGFYLTAFCGMLDFSSKKLVYSNHGHPPQILVQTRENNIIFMDSQTFLMGIGMADERVYDAEVSFRIGDRLILFTDGIIEARNKGGELFGYENLKTFTRDNIGLDVNEFNKQLLDKVNNFQCNAQSDDIFLLSIQTKTGGIL
jgi:serine phosphatase RsbU (regulator of sigma subunit)